MTNGAPKGNRSTESERSYKECPKCRKATQFKGYTMYECIKLPCSCPCHSVSTDVIAEWEKELLSATEKSWGFIATESKKEAMMKDYSRRRQFILSLLTQAREEGFADGYMEGNKDGKDGMDDTNEVAYQSGVEKGRKSMDALVAKEHDEGFKEGEKKGREEAVEYIRKHAGKYCSMDSLADNWSSLLQEAKSNKHGTECGACGASFPMICELLGES